MKCQTRNCDVARSRPGFKRALGGGHDGSGGGRRRGRGQHRPRPAARSVALRRVRLKSGVDWVGTTPQRQRGRDIDDQGGKAGRCPVDKFPPRRQRRPGFDHPRRDHRLHPGNAFGLQQYMGFSVRRGPKGSRPLVSIAEPDATLGDRIRGRRGGPYRLHHRVGTGHDRALLQRQRARRWPANGLSASRGRHWSTQAPATPQVLYLKSTGEHLPGRSRAEL